jgi:hypothetical protein
VRLFRFALRTFLRSVRVTSSSEDRQARFRNKRALARATYRGGERNVGVRLYSRKPIFYGLGGFILKSDAVLRQPASTVRMTLALVRHAERTRRSNDALVVQQRERDCIPVSDR